MSTGQKRVKCYICGKVVKRGEMYPVTYKSPLKFNLESLKKDGNEVWDWTTTTRLACRHHDGVIEAAVCQETSQGDTST